jgi:hypothetical protein
VPIARDHDVTIWQPNSSSRGGRRRTAWTNAKTPWYQASPHDTQKTTGIGFLLRKLERRDNVALVAQQGLEE